MINLNPHIEATLENLNNAIKKFEKAWFDLEKLKTYINNKKFKKFVLLLGWWQISGSLSPFMHTYNSSFSQDDKKFLYTLINLEKKSIDLKDLLDYIENTPQILGANVTMPYKIEIFNILKQENKLDESALLVWAVNTIVKKDGKIIGFNTDMEGIRKPLKEKINPKNIKNWYILGAWGAAQAWIAALLSLGITNIVIFNRSKKDQLIKHFTSKKVKHILKEKYGINEDINIQLIQYNVANNDKISPYIEENGILINTLPFGFKENLPKKWILNEEFEKIKNKLNLFFDVVYDMNKQDTPLLQNFKKENIATCDGKDMVINQAIKWFEEWTNWEKFKKEEINKMFRNK